MTNETNRGVYLTQRVKGMPGPETWDVRDSSANAPKSGEILVRVEFISIDPAMRGWIEEVSTYVESVAIGGVMRGEAVGKIIESRAEGFKAGDYVTGPMGVQHFWTGKPDPQWFSKIDAFAAPPQRYLSALGVTGVTAYFGLLEVGAMRGGDVVVVSAAAGAVGGLVGQIARIKGASRVVGIAGGPEKCAWLTNELGFDAAVDYKAGNLTRALRTATGGPIDVFFDSVGGETLEAGLRLIGRGARVVICGAIASYNDPSALTGPRAYFNLVLQRARMEGFIAYDYAERYEEALAPMRRWLDEGRLKSPEHIEKGLDRFPEVFGMLFRGQNFGKLILDIRES
ncbi:MAG: NADP-dependent oxidoreductase [Caulobacterales bacterium]